jgi:alginate O-acetyltransferase complex protein AlgI
MVFSSIFFLFYFLPVFLIVYYILPSSWRNYWTLLCSLVFYAWGAPRYVFLLVATTIINFYVVQKMFKVGTESRKKWWLVLSIIFNLGLLIVFKYTNFFITNVNVLLTKIHSGNIAWHEIALPIGISFCVFHSITYSVDVYRKIRPPCDSVTDYMMYIFLFPQLVAGPIIRFNLIADEIRDRKKNETLSNVLKGLIRFAIGLSKKVLLANVLGSYVDKVYAVPAGANDSLTLLLATIAYSFQIYFDFAGYSDMAIGLGKMIGFHFPENFNVPYIAKNITEFWRRWHMTLSAFMRDYLYIPLGGNRVKTRMRLYFNLWIVFLVSGLWHGANWTFVVWGAYHGLFLVIDRLFYRKWSEWLNYFSIPLNFLVVTLSWIVFRADNIQNAWGILRKICEFSVQTDINVYDVRFWIILSGSILFSFSPLIPVINRLMEKIHETEFSFKGMAILSVSCALLLILSISSIITSGFNPFIYFRF